LAAVSEDILSELAKRSMVRQLRAGETLFSEDDEASGLYIVIEGDLRSVRRNAKGREQVLSTEGPGAILAAVPVFNGGKFFSTVIAVTAVEILCLEKHDLHRLCHQHTELLWNLARVLAHKVRHYANLIETLALRNVDQRVAQHLLTVCQERAVRSGRGYLIELKTTRSELASRVGSTREVVSRALSHLQHAGLIQLRGARLVSVPDIQALSRFAGTEHKLDQARLVSDLSSDIA
jgi:CRP/FNR family transcriptional regulator